MNNLNDAEINHRLALAIGYEPSLVYTTTRKAVVWHHTGPKNSLHGWYSFDYRDPAVIWPIAERFNLFPVSYDKEWSAGAGWQDTAAKAVALAVIKAKGQK